MLVLTTTKIERFLFCLLVFLASVILILNVTNNDVRISSVFYLSFVVALAIYVLACRRHFGVSDIVCILSVILALVAVTVNLLLSSYSPSFEYFKKVLIFATTMVFMMSCQKVSVDRGMRLFLEWTYTLLSAFCAVFFIMFRSTMYSNINLLYFNMENANFAGLFLAVFAMSQFAFTMRSTWTPFRIAHLILGVFMSYLVFETKARNAETALTIFILIAILLFFFGKDRDFSIPRWVAVAAAVLPLVFAVLYLALVNLPFFGTLFSSFSDVGKGLDARETIWKYALSNIRQHPVFGAYSQISDGFGFSQMHNTHIDIWASYGTLTLISVCYFLYRTIYQNGRRYNKTQTAFMLAFVFSIMLGNGEAALFSGGQGLYVFVCCFLLLCSDDPDNNNRLGDYAYDQI